MTSEPIADALTDLGFRGLAADLEAFIARAKKERWSTTELIEQLVEVERVDRARRSLERRATRSKVGAFKPLTDFDWGWFRSVDRDAIDRVMKLDFVDEGANVVIVGPHGIGKTTLLKNICHQAIIAGQTVLFTTASKLIGDVTGTDSPSMLHRRLKYYVRMSVLAIDELGYLSYDQRAADLLFEIVSRRHEVGKPVLISTNLAFREWNTVFPHATCTVALVDRLTHRADVIKLDAESWRRKESQERAERHAVAE